MNTPSDYVTLLHDMVIENNIFGYMEHTEKEIKDITKDVNFIEPISVDIHNNVLGILLDNVKIQVP